MNQGYIMISKIILANNALIIVKLALINKIAHLVKWIMIWSKINAWLNVIRISLEIIKIFSVKNVNKDAHLAKI